MGVSILPFTSKVSCLVILVLLLSLVDGFLLPVQISFDLRSSVPEHRRRPAYREIGLAAVDSQPPSAPSPAQTQAEESDVDEIIDAAMDQSMHTVAMDWENVDPAPIKLQTSAGDENSSLRPNPFAAYEEFIEPPPTHVVYYRGHHERSFWRQGRDVVQLVVPVDPAVTKADIVFELATKTHLRLRLGDEPDLFDRELAQPVHKDGSFWYFEEHPETEQKAVVIELDKRLEYSNWPKLFAADVDLSEDPSKASPVGDSPISF